MAKQEHLYRLNQGVFAWNTWRDEHLEVQPNLLGADLKKADLSRAALSEADLTYANLSEAHLSEAHLFTTVALLT